ncbi:hypothetical protein [Bacillus wiedmannii]|uniref:hypothetical protein n=1 Tax=Bacillus wiedmannii TaxID=1890302 RepID=UPI000BFD7DAA|nr:hypothetical protein [Bacillus wiedmannii]PHG79762.1 hypothetical protein COI50_05300 [Bacillus wiedmannii]
MEYSHQAYKDLNKNKSKWNDTFKKGIEGLADIPIVGNSVKTGVTILTESYQNKRTFQKAIRESTPQINYFVLDSNNYYDDLAQKVYKILENQSIQQKYKFNISDVKVEINEFSYDDNWENIEHALDITFMDNQYYNESLNENEFGSIFIIFNESFKQINFVDNKVYTVFETTSLGGNCLYNSIDRDYIEFAYTICYLLGNPHLL